MKKKIVKDKIFEKRKNILNAALKILCLDPIFAYIAYKDEDEYYDLNYVNVMLIDNIRGKAEVSNYGSIYINKNLDFEPRELAFIIAHCTMHLFLGHFKRSSKKWNLVCDAYINKFLIDMKVGQPFNMFHDSLYELKQDEESLFEKYSNEDLPSYFEKYSTSSSGTDMIFEKRRFEPANFEEIFGNALMYSMQKTFRKVANSEKVEKETLAVKAKKYFVNNFPLLGALASNFKIIEDGELCMRMEVAIGAVSYSLREIYINPGAKLNYEEMKFVIAHEMLHAGLNHGGRREGRDPYLYNVACDYVINGWLKEMEIGVMHEGLLYDENFKNMSAESIYDLIVNDIRKFKKLSTLRGKGLGDILDGDEYYKSSDGISLDEFYRRCLKEGLDYHINTKRGTLPGGLIEEINALDIPPIPWDVALAHWFDENFPPLEKKRTYAIPSRRQSSTPNIPKPSYKFSEEDYKNRTYGVILDTSGSMDRSLLAIALGSIISYSESRDVKYVRVVFCDADYYDKGYMDIKDLAHKVEVKGRGGTVLQPAINFLERTRDFPKDAPILIITDGYCDVLTIKRTHGFLVPFGSRLPFNPRGDVFYFRE